MKNFNVTAQIYDKFDQFKQTILVNDVIKAVSQDEAKNTFREIHGINNEIVKIYSVIEIKDAA
jgi:hypothetical protein